MSRHRDNEEGRPSEGDEEQPDEGPRRPATDATNTAETRIATMPRARHSPAKGRGGVTSRLERMLPSVRRVNPHERPTRAISRDKETVLYSERGTVLKSSDEITGVRASGHPAREDGGADPQPQPHPQPEAPESSDEITGLRMLDSIEVLDPYAMSGLHIVEDIVPNQELAQILTQLRMQPLALRGAFSARLAEILVDALGDSGIESRASNVHVLASLARVSGAPEHVQLARHLDRVALAIQPELLYAQHALLADAYARQHLPHYTEHLEHLVEHAQGLQEAGGSVALSSALVELGLLLEFHQEREHDSLRGIVERSVRHAEGSLTAPLSAARFGLSRGDEDLVDAAFQALLSSASEPLREAFVLEYVAYLWHTRGDVDGASRTIREQLVRGRSEQRPLPYALKLIAWEARDTELEAEITTQRIAWLVAQGKRAAKSERRRRRALKKQAGAQLYRLYEVYALRGDLGRAERHLSDALRVYPNSLLFLQAREKLERQARDAAALEQSIARQIALVTEPERLAALHYQRAVAVSALPELRGERSNDLLQALEHDPGFLPAASLLGRIFLEEGQYEALYELWRGIGASGPKAQRWQRDNARVREADILENLLEDLPRALGSFRSALEGGDCGPMVLRGLERTGYRTRRFELLAESLERALELETSREAQLDLTWKLAQIHEGELEDLPGAISWYLRYLALEPTQDDALEALLSAYHAGGYLEEATQLAEQLESYSSRPRFQEELQRWRERFDIEATGRIRVSSEDELDALLARGDWRGIHAALVQRAERDGEPRERGEHLLRAAQVARDRLHDNATARRDLERALELAPRWLPILDLLEEVLIEEGEREAHAQALERRASIVSTPRWRARCLEQAATIRADELGDAESAERLYREALVAWPQDTLSWRGLRRCLEARGGWDELAELIRDRVERSTSDSTRVKLLRELGQLERFVRHRPDAALACFAQLLDYQHDDVVALRSIAGLHASRGNHAEEAAYRRMLAEALAPGPSRIDARVRQLQAEIHAHGRPSLDGLRELTQEAPEHPSLEHLGAMLSAEERMQLSLNPSSVQESALMGWLQVARSQPAGEMSAQARYALEQAWAQRPTFIPVQLALLQLYEADGSWREAAHVAHNIAQCVPEGPLQTRAWHGAAERWLKAGEGEAAVGILEALLVADPGDREAYASLERHYQHTADRQRLALLQSRYASAPASGVSLQPEDDITVSTLEQQIQGDLRPYESGYRRALEELIQRNPSTAEHLRTLAMLEEREGRFEAAAQRWQDVHARTREPAQQTELRLHVGRLLLDRCGQPERASIFFRSVVERSGERAEAHLGLARSLEAVGDVTGAVPAYRRYFMLEEGVAERRWVSLRLAAIYRDRLLRLDDAARWYATALEVDPESADAREALEHLQRMGVAGAVSAVSGVRTSGVAPPLEVSGWGARAIREQVASLRLSHAAQPALFILLEVLREREGLSATEQGLYDQLAPRFSALPEGYLSRDEVLECLLHPDARGPLGELLVILAPELAAHAARHLRGVGSQEGHALGPEEHDWLPGLVGDLTARLGMGPTPIRHDNGSTHAPIRAGSGALLVSLPALQRSSREVIAPACVAALEELRDNKALIAAIDDLEDLVLGCLGVLFPALFDGSGPAHQAGAELARGLPRRKRRGLHGVALGLEDEAWSVERWRRGAQATPLRAAIFFARGATLLDLVRQDTGDALLTFVLSEDFATLAEALFPEAR